MAGVRPSEGSSCLGRGIRSNSVARIGGGFWGNGGANRACCSTFRGFDYRAREEVGMDDLCGATIAQGFSVAADDCVNIWKNVSGNYDMLK